METHLIPRIGKVPVQKVTIQEIKKIKSDLLTTGYRPNDPKPKAGEEAKAPRGLSAQSALHVFRILSQALKAATQESVIVRNPADKVKAPNPKRAREENPDQESGSPIKALEQEQVNGLFTALWDKPIFTLAVLATGTGLRRGELLALRWSDLDLEKRTVRVNRAVDLTKEFGVRIKECPKNDSSRRTIGIDDELCATLQGHRKAQEALAGSLGVDYPADCLVFPCVIRRQAGQQPLKQVAHDVSFTRPWHPDAITKEFGREATRAGFPDLSLHDLRHTHATLLLQEGIPVHAVAQRLGHANPVITLTVYAHVLPRSEGEAVRVSGNILKAALAARASAQEPSVTNGLLIHD